MSDIGRTPGGGPPIPPGSTSLAGPQPVEESSARRLVRILGASTGLIVIALGLGLGLAASLGGIVWLIATAIHHASTG